MTVLPQSILSFAAILPEASEHARNVDLLFWSLMGISLLIVLFLLFLILYGLTRRKPADQGLGAKLARNSWKIETLWMVIPMLIFLGLFAWGAQRYFDIFSPSEVDYTVYVVGRQWMWQSYYPDGYSEQNTLHLPNNATTRLIISSEDVIHSLYIPAFRLKQDAVPGRQVQISVKPVLPGKYRLLCAEYCGTDHSRMGGFAHVLPQDQFAEWEQRHAGLTDLAEKGRQLFHKHGCSGCHAPESTIHAPLLNGLFGSRVALQNGQVRTATINYLRDSMMLPGKDIVAGYENKMPTFQNILTEPEIAALLAYLQSLEDSPTP